MVGKGKGKKAAPAVAVEAEAVASNGDVSQEAEAASEVVAAIAPAKKGRQRGVKKETKGEVDETPAAPVEAVVEKPAKPAKAAKGSKKGSKGKTAAAAPAAAVEEDEKIQISAEDTKDEDISENDSASIEVKQPAAVVEKKAPIRKRKVDNTEKTDDSEAVIKKAPRVTKTKGAKKETVDSEGIPEDPSAAGAAILPATQTNGAPKVEELEPETIADEQIPEEPKKVKEEKDEAAPAKRGPKSKSSKKEPKKAAPKTKASKKAPKVAEEPEDEEATEHDVLPEDEFVPEIEEEEEEPKPKKVVKSKGSRKQVAPAPQPPVEEEKKQEPIDEDEPEEPQESEADSASAIELSKMFTPKQRTEIVTLYIENNRSVVPTQRAYRRKHRNQEPPSEETILYLVSNSAEHGAVGDRRPATANQRNRRSNELVEPEEEEQQPTKAKQGRKAAPAAKKEKAPAKKATSKKAPKGGKKATKDEPQEEDQQKPVDEDELEDEDKPVEKLNKNNEEDQEAADVETSKRKMNGTAKPAAMEPDVPKAGRGRKRAAPATAPPVAETDKTEKKPGRGRKRAATAPEPTEEAVNDDDETDGSKIAKLDAPLNATKTEYNSSDFTFDKEYNMKISSWNIAGLRAWLKKDGLAYLQHEQPDILCLQEIKCTPDKLPEEARIPGYHPYWLCMPGGYAGVAVYSKIMPIHVEYGIGNAEHDEHGRIITAEYEKFYLISVYVPNSGRQLVNLDKRMQWEELFREYLQKLEKVKPVIIAGDMNVSHQEIDLANPKTNTKSAGFTPQEREQMTKLLSLGYVDTFRHFHPDQKGAYTFWTYMKNARAKNVGWRLDYFILSERILSKAVESTIRPQVLGSDHCPITLFLNI